MSTVEHGLNKALGPDSHTHLRSRKLRYYAYVWFSGIPSDNLNEPFLFLSHERFLTLFIGQLLE